MTTAALNLFLYGATAMGAAVAGLFFLRFWRRSGDRLFAGFAVAFWLLALNWALLALTDPANESRWLFYLLRLAAFCLILFAIVDKNRRRPA
jgi:hypothetical protein